MGRGTPEHKAIPSNEVLKHKRGPDGEVKSYRVRIVAGGHRQVHGVNYTETFLSAAKMPTVRVVLNAPLKETVYMKPPHGVLKPGEEGKVCRLLKGLYGLKQAGRGWYLEMTKVFIQHIKEESRYSKTKGGYPKTLGDNRSRTYQLVPWI